MLDGTLYTVPTCDRLGLKEMGSILEREMKNIEHNSWKMCVCDTKCPRTT